MQRYDLAVVGAGIEGSWTALQAVRSGQVGRVVLLEQFPLPHARGSSHGQSRIIRHAYTELYHAQLMPQAFREWRTLEREYGERLLIDKPLLCIANKTGDKALADTLAALRNVLPGGEGTQFRQLSAADLRKEFPQATFSDQHRGIIENCAGLLRADKCLDAVQKKFKSLGGVLKDGVKVVSLSSSRSGVEIKVASGDNIIADKVAVCAGPWTSKLIDPLLPNRLPLTPLRVNVYYWRIKENGPGAIPTSYIDLGDGGEFWGIPEFEYPGLVKYLHPTHIKCDPENRDLIGPDQYNQELNEIKTHIASYFPGVDVSEPTIVETCMYTMTPDHTSIIDFVPNGNNNIVFACGLSGTGFKKAPMIGKIVKDMLLPPGDMDIAPFSLARFQK